MLKDHTARVTLIKDTREQPEKSGSRLKTTTVKKVSLFLWFGPAQAGNSLTSSSTKKTRLI